MHRPLKTFATAIGSIVLLGGLAMLVALSGIGSGTGVSAQEEDTTNRTISVTGEGQVSTSPDAARAIIGVQETGEDLSEVLTSANERMDEVIQVLRDEGIPEDEIQTRDFSVRVERDHEASGNPITGFTVINLVEFTVSPIDDVADVIDQAVDAGANQVNTISFIVKNRDAAIQQARERAMEDARAKAEHFAELGDLNLGSIASISETAGTPPAPVAEEADAVGGAGPPIAPGQQTVRVVVQVVWEIQ